MHKYLSTFNSLVNNFVKRSVQSTESYIQIDKNIKLAFWILPIGEIIFHIFKATKIAQRLLPNCLICLAALCSFPDKNIY